MNNKKIKKIAFTLSETLVTLAIIGVVMALMLRAVNRVSPNKEKLLFLKGYRAVEQAIETSINDPDKYDQAYYTQEQISTMSNAGTAHIDFKFDPNERYVTKINDTTYCTAESNEEGCTTINKANAVCVWLAESINTVGDVNCANNNTRNFQASNGVCYGDWYGVDDNGDIIGYIDPICDGTKSNKVKVFANGRVTVPKEVTSGSGVSATTATNPAYEWMQNQTDLK